MYAEDVMPTRRWSDLSERTRRLLMTAAVADGALRVAALIDIKAPAGKPDPGPETSIVDGS
jgi:hypothetical protein